jgi:hypothetical protein
MIAVRLRVTNLGKKTVRGRLWRVRHGLLTVTANL